MYEKEKNPEKIKKYLKEEYFTIVNQNCEFSWDCNFILSPKKWQPIFLYMKNASSFIIYHYKGRLRLLELYLNTIINEGRILDLELFFKKYNDLNIIDKLYLSKFYRPQTINNLFQKSLICQLSFSAIFPRISVGIITTYKKKLYANPNLMFEKDCKYIRYFSNFVIVFNLNMNSVLDNGYDIINDVDDIYLNEHLLDNKELSYIKNFYKKKK